MFVVLLFAGCRKAEIQTYDIPERSQLNDSLKTGNYVWVADTLQTLKSRALADNDSLRWAYYINEEGAVNYFLGKFDSVVLKADSAAVYASLRKGTPEVDNLLKLSSRLKGAYYQQYDFKPDSAIKYQRIALNHTSKQNHAEYIMALANLADAHKLIANYPEASDLYHQAVLYADSVKADPAQCEMAYSGLAGVYTAINDFDEAEVWWQKTMTLYNYMDPYAKFANLNNLGNHYYKRKDYARSLATFKRLSNFLDSINATDWEKNFCRANLADIYISVDSLNRAEALLKNLVPYFEEKAPNSVPLSHLHNLQMRLAAAKNNQVETERLIALHPLADSIRNEQREGRLEALVNYYSSIGQWHNAFTARQELQTLKDSVASQNVKYALGAERLAYERDRHMLELKADNSQKEARIFRLFMILGVSLLAVVGLALAVIVVRMRNRRHEERMLKKIVDLRMESVRNRITPHFIYNALNQELLARERGCEPQLPVIVSLLKRQQLMAENIADSIADELAFMRDYIEVAKGRSNAPFQYLEQIDDSIDINNIKIPAMSLQILAENAFKHSFPTLPEGEARRLWVEVVTEENSVVVRVTSNLNPEVASPAQEGRLGLRIISETINYMNTTYKTRLAFHAGLDAGTFWVASITCSGVPAK